jgi:hypothetical protein
MDIAYNSERSIEDGIEDMSNAEMYTVIISYVVMFVYITFALGKIRGISTFLVSMLKLCGVTKNCHLNMFEVTFRKGIK